MKLNGFEASPGADNSDFIRKFPGCRFKIDEVVNGAPPKVQAVKVITCPYLLLVLLLALLLRCCALLLLWRPYWCSGVPAADYNQHIQHQKKGRAGLVRFLARAMPAMRCCCLLCAAAAYCACMCVLLCVLTSSVNAVGSLCNSLLFILQYTGAVPRFFGIP